MGFTHKLYYLLKPFIPKWTRLLFRRLRAEIKLRATKDWPIMESAAQEPPGWIGWPDEKQFAFVLTHDVEGQLGLDRCESLAAIELRLGFRSSFNFVPEGEYRVSSALLDKLTSKGFEIGVHDFKHDGTLYRSRLDFETAARSINKYLKEWNAVGFRSGFMFHNIDWLRLLEIEYDASTFDTDPFEPQSDGVGTIFPFCVERSKDNNGFVELPYTLPQDSTMFLVFRNNTVDVWKKKVDWLAKKGGMVLLNVHPDYLSFYGNNPGLGEYSSALYEELLTYVKEKYNGQYWHTLPYEMARYIRQLQCDANETKKIAIGSS